MPSLDPLLQGLFLAIFSSIIPVSFSYFMIWKKEEQLVCFRNFPKERNALRHSLVMTIFYAQLVFANTFFKPVDTLGAFGLSIALRSLFLTLFLCWMYLILRNRKMSRKIE